MPKIVKSSYPQHLSTPLSIAIDARMYGTAQRGIGRYLMKLIEALEEIVPSPQPSPAGRGRLRTSPLPLGEGQGEGYTFTIFLRRANWDEYQPKNPNFKKALWNAPWYGWREQFFFLPLYRGANYESTANLRISNSQIRKFGSNSQFAPSIYHFPHWNVPLLFRKPFIVTIHDLELFSSNRTRENSTRGRLLYALKHLAFRLVFRHAVLASRAIIVPSNVVREQLLDLYPQVRKKVQVIYEAPTIEGSGVRGQVLELKPITYNLKPQCYALYVGAAYPHKNLPRLLEAWKLVHKELPDYKLVLAGREDFFWKKLKAHNSQLLTHNSVIFYGEATDEALTMLYRHASLLVQPSLEEGFSLAPLEALSFDCPAAVSDIPVHREILGEAALYFNPRDPHTIASALVHALTHPEARTAALTHTAAILSRYSWRTHAQQTLHLYEKQKIR